MLLRKLNFSKERRGRMKGGMKEGTGLGNVGGVQWREGKEVLQEIEMRRRWRAMVTSAN